MKLLPPPQINPINKDAVIDDFKRRLAATEFQRDAMNTYTGNQIGKPINIGANRILKSIGFKVEMRRELYDFYQS